jgi:ParB-like chromosome segregation protein Spo0J
VVPVRTDTLLEHPSNARTHSPAQITKIVNSIREFGFTNPILTDGKLGVLAGHGRLMAAKQLGLKTVPTIALSLTAKQRRAYVIADNKLALDAEWDEGLLASVLGDLRDAKFDLALTGFDEKELGDLLSDLSGEAAAPEPREKVTTTQKVVCPSCGHNFRL